MMRNCVLTFMIMYLLCANITLAQIITTFAGNGVSGFSGDGGAATAAQISSWDFTFDSFGNMYLAEVDSNRIRKIDLNGIITTIAGTGVAGYAGDGGAASLAKFNRPFRIRIDATGNIYVSEQGNNVIRKINTSGIITTIAGIGTSGFSGDGGAATNAQLSFPVLGCIDRYGNLYVSTDNRRIRKISPLGIISTIAGSAVYGYGGDGGPATDAYLRNPYGIALDDTGNVYFTDNINSVIRKIDTFGTINTLFGIGGFGFTADGLPASGAYFYSPLSLIRDRKGNFYFNDMLNYKVRMIDTAGILHTLAGNGVSGYSGDGGPATAAEFMRQVNLEFDCAGNLYCADLANYRIRTISYDNIPRFVTGAEQHFDICRDSVLNLDAYLSVIDTDLSQPETWSLSTFPSHGTVSGSYTATSSGGTLTPTGFTYTPVSGYLGTDTFSIKVNDCRATSTSKFSISLNNCALITNNAIKAAGGGIFVNPNPASEFFSCTIKSSFREATELIVTDMAGAKIVSYGIFTNSSQQIYPNLPPGMYLLTAITSSGKFTNRLVVEK